MYNFPHTPIPMLFPVSEGALLRPWFSLTSLDQGLQLIRDRRISSFHAIRNTVGALIDNQAPVLLEFIENDKLHQGFAVRTHHCSLCRHQTKHKTCEHTAALAILSLIVPVPGARAVPLPCGFTGSSWSKIGLFLHDWLGRSKINAGHTPGTDFSLWEITTAGGAVRVNIAESWQSLITQLLPLLRRGSAPAGPDQAITLLFEQLQRLTMTHGERALTQAGGKSIGWQKQSSPWLGLARMLYACHGDALPELHHNPTSGRFELRTGDRQDAGWCTIELPPERTWDILRILPFSPELVTVLPAAKECFRLFFNDDSRLEVHPCLRLADGRVLSRHDLAEKRYGSVYFLAGEGFVPTVRLPIDAVFSSTAPQSAMPLLHFLANEKSRDQPFTVAVNEIPTFLAANQKALHCPDNIIAAELIDLRIHDIPDRLVIETFEEHDDWCYLSCRYGLGNTSISLADICQAKAHQLSCLPGKQWLRIDGTPLSWFYDLAQQRLALDDFGRLRLSYREMLSLTAIIPQIEIRLKKNSASRNGLTWLLDPASWTDDQPLDKAPAHLRGYQRNGLAWLRRLYRLGLGGLLADDMGLGKTHQGLALLQSVAEDRRGTMLVICPASVVLNWAEKIDQFYQGLKYAIYYGTQRNLSEAQRHGLMLTTYGVVRQDIELLRHCRFDIILLDEIQHAKNHNTAIHQAVAALEGRVKIGLTGTPVENSLQDLRSLFALCLPGLLGSAHQFEKLYAQPISAGGNTEVRERLGRLIHPFILRRTRRQVLDELPAVIEDDRICELSDDQIGLYREVIGSTQKELEELESGSAAVPYLHILAAITRLKQICCHPCLVQGCNDPGEYSSGKWDLFVELTAELLAADMKFVVFSQYAGMLTMIERHLDQAGIGYASLKGDMPPGTRQKMIGEFNSSPRCRVFCASLLAGGIGIDLTAAQAVIHYDRWWNPAREEQATARVHRMGQKNVVQVLRLITKGTLEEKIHRLINRKRTLATSLLQEDEAGVIKQLDRRQLAELFRFAPGISG